MNVVILAAGQGKRMRSGLPKVLHRIAGRPMLAHVIDSARQLLAADRGEATDAALAARGHRIVVVVGHGADAVRDAFGGEAELQWVVQEPQLGTGHAVGLAAPLLDGDGATIVLYGDVPLVKVDTLRTLAAAAAAGGVAVLTQRLADPTGYGRIVRGVDGGIVRIVEQRDASPDEQRIDEVNTGIVVAPTGPLKRWLAALDCRNAQQEYYLTDIVTAALRDGVRVNGVTLADPDEAAGVNSRAQLAAAERYAQSRIARALMDAGATLLDPARIDVRGRLDVGRDVTIDVGCIFEGAVELGDRVTVGPYCVLRDVRVAAGTEILGFSHLDGAQVGADARLGPFARLRPGAEIGDRVHIGNFVEVKASLVEAGAKANHLAYIGDARVGAGTNIGAGTIVANYDGVNKHRTDIGKNVLVGSNVVLVAPVTVGDDATVGAGSTVSRDVPAGELTVARARQATIRGWQRPKRKPKPAS
ncbi:MAG TPA: bifunctional UDP-N-acetylglucosamine diphosphorylase/glucosamine-1-phosphate N-acetyltransferase GlmU [Burkholderiaceae bacterium]|nr:bifunctional UDP-N-acetylglucosamine diphosphorylase/glucosamine-1-phosphate N-acetyltransferase GlmU [Burkholderiaceae bacterium]